MATIDHRRSGEAGTFYRAPESTRTDGVGKTPLPHAKEAVSNQEILNLLLGLSKTDLSWVLSRLAENKPELNLSFDNLDANRGGMGVWEGTTPGELQAYNSGVIQTVTQGEYTLLNAPLISPLEARSSPYCRDHTPRTATVVQFSAGEFFCKEDEGSVEIEVNRSGDKSGESSVRFYTKDQSTNSGGRYVPKDGVLTFSPGVGSAKFSVEVTNSSTWEGLAEFRVYLEPESVTNCSLGQQLQFTRVKIIASSTFPSNMYREQLEGGNKEPIHSIYWVSLLSQYLLMNYHNRRVRTGTIARCLLDQLHNCTFLLHLFCQVYLLDYVVNIDRHWEALFDHDLFRDRYSYLFVVALADALCVLVSYISHTAKRCFTVGGPSRQVLMQGIIMAYLNYDFATANKLGAGGHVTVGLTRDSVELVKEGYTLSLKFMHELGGVFVKLAFVLACPYMFNKKFEPKLLLPFLLFPILSAIFITCRSRKTTDSLRAKHHAQEELAAYGGEAVFNRGLILDYKLRQDFVDRLEEHVGSWNKTNRDVNVVMFHNRQFMEWLKWLLLGWWVIFGGYLVIHRELSIGLFVGTYKVYESVGAAFAQAYDVALKLENVVPALTRICMILNAPSDLDIRLQNERANRRETTLKRTELAKRYPTAALNHVKILVKDIVFKFGSGFGRRDGQTVFSGTVEIEQNTMVCFIGPEGQGKSTLMRLLGGAIVPTLLRGSLFVPSHLRVLHVMSEPLFFRGTMLYNLTFGCLAEDDANTERVQKLLDRLRIPKEIHLNSETKWDWNHVLTMTQCHKLNMIRALVANPHLLCVHKPTLVYDEDISKIVISLLREFVRGRGVYQDERLIEQRRPRTCVFTSSKQIATDAADVIYRVHSSRVERLQKGDAIYTTDLS